MHDNHRARAKLSLEWKEAIKDLCSPTGKRKQQLRFYSGSGIGAFSVLTWSFWKMPENACYTLQVKRQGSGLCWVGCSVATWYDYFLMAWESGTESWLWCTLETISDCGFFTSLLTDTPESQLGLLLRGEVFSLYKWGDLNFWNKDTYVSFAENSGGSAERVLFLLTPHTSLWQFKPHHHIGRKASQLLSLCHHVTCLTCGTNMQSR